MSGTSPPLVSVVIPTHNRLPFLRRCLSALAHQTLPEESLEIIVVADGCTDGTDTALSESEFPVPLRVLSQDGAGAAAARNRGAEASRGGILLFVDDDVILSEGAVEAHVDAHRASGQRVVIGPYRIEAKDDHGYLQEGLKRFWDSKFDALGAESHVPDYQDVVSGNLSLRSSVFHRAGGFDEIFPSCGMEDYELGVRLLAAGVMVAYAPDAHAIHLETTDLLRSLERSRRVGAATVALVTLHPHLLPTTNLEGPRRWIGNVILDHPDLTRIMSAVARSILPWAERLRIRPVWRTIHRTILLMHFWLGVHDEVGSRGGLDDLIEGLPKPPSPDRP